MTSLATLSPDVLLQIALHLNPRDMDSFLSIFPHLAPRFTFRHAQAEDKRRNNILHYLVLHEQLFQAMVQQEASSPSGDSGSDSELLIKKDMPLNLQNKRGVTPLHIAVGHARSKSVRFLLSQPQVDVNVRDNCGYAPVDVAVKRGDIELVRMFSELRSDVVFSETKGTFYLSALNIAAEYGHEEIVKLLLQREELKIDLPDGDGFTALARAASKGHTSIVELLLDRDDANYSFDATLRALFEISTAAGSIETIKAIIHRNKDRLDTVDELGCGIVHHVAVVSRPDMMSCLLEVQGIKVDTPDHHGCTPLSHAAVSGEHAIVRMLLAYPGVDVNSQDQDGKTPLAIAASYGHDLAVELLLADSRIEVDRTSYVGRTPLMRAAARGYLGVVKQLVDKGANIDLQDANGQAAIQYAARRRMELVVQYLLPRSRRGQKLMEKHGDEYMAEVLKAYGGHALIQGSYERYKDYKEATNPGHQSSEFYDSLGSPSDWPCDRGRHHDNEGGGGEDGGDGGDGGVGGVGDEEERNEDEDDEDRHSYGLLEIGDDGECDSEYDGDGYYGEMGDDDGFDAEFDMHDHWEFAWGFDDDLSTSTTMDEDDGIYYW